MPFSTSNSSSSIHYTQLSFCAIINISTARTLIYWKVDISYLFHSHIIRKVRLLLSYYLHYERFWYCTTRGYLTTPHYQSVLPNWFFELFFEIKMSDFNCHHHMAYVKISIIVSKLLWEWCQKYHIPFRFLMWRFVRMG